MKIYHLLILNIFILFSCKTNDKTPKKNLEKDIAIYKNADGPTKINTLQDTIDIYIPEFALYEPKYSPFKESLLSEIDLKKYKNIQTKLTDTNGNFLGDTDDNDIIGHPDFNYEGLSIWINDKNRKKETFNAIKISKGYGLYYDDDKLILITEATRTKEDFKIDSIFFDNKILVWKGHNQTFVNEPKTINGKESYLNRISEEIQEIYNSELGYIENYHYAKDSISSFVIGNLIH